MTPPASATAPLVGGAPFSSPVPRSGPFGGPLGLLAVVLEHRRLILAVPSVLVLLVGVTTLAAPRTYTATTSFLAQSGDGGRSRLSGLAAQLGVAIPGGASGQSPEFYAQLVKSPEILAPVVDSALDVAGRSVRVADHYGLEGDAADPARRDDAIRLLAQRLSVNTGRETGIITVDVRDESPATAAAIAGRLVALVNDFNLRARQAQAAAEQRFVEDRLDDVRRELRVAEDRLQGFLQRNREFRGDPQLAFDFDRLTREVAMRQDVYTALAQSHEQARVEAVRNTPVVTLVRRPTPPVRPDPRGLVTKMLMAGVVGLLLAGALAFAQTAIRRSSAVHPDAVAELGRLRAQGLADLRRLTPWRRRRATVES